MGTDPDVNALLRKFTFIRKEAKKIKDTLEEAPDFLTRIRFIQRQHTAEKLNSIIMEYNKAVPQFEKIRDKYNLEIIIQEISSFRYPAAASSDDIMKLTQQLIAECEQAIGALETIQIFPQQRTYTNQLNDLRNELKKVSKAIKNQDYVKNLEVAIKEFEVGHHLASILISGRVIMYLIDQLPGKSIDDKVDNLVKKRVISGKDTDLKKRILKADKVVRNLFTHNIKAFPEASEALSLLADATKILQGLSKIL